MENKVKKQDSRPDRTCPKCGHFNCCCPAEEIRPGQVPKYTETADLIRDECNALAVMLIQKNEAYGDSAISPKRIFSRSDSVEQIKVRIDDKLSRMANQKDGQDAMGEDIEKDLLGYLILLRVARRKLIHDTPKVPIGYGLERQIDPRGTPQ